NMTWRSGRDTGSDAWSRTPRREPVPFVGTSVRPPVQPPADRSHPEDAEARFLHRGIEAGGKGEAQHAARLGRQDDAVVPQARGGVIGVAFLLVAVADRGLEGLFVLGAPRLALGL